MNYKKGDILVTHDGQEHLVVQVVDGMDLIFMETMVLYYGEWEKRGYTISTAMADSLLLIEEDA